MTDRSIIFRRTAKLSAACLVLVIGSIPSQAQTPLPGKAAGVRVTGPLADVPAGQMLVVYIPEAARVMARVDALLQVTHLEPSRNLLRGQVARLSLHQRLGPDSELTFCIGPPPRLGGQPARAALVTGLDTGRVVGRIGADDRGIYVRQGALDVMLLDGPAVALGEAEDLQAVARARRGVALTVRQREVLADADILVQLNLAIWLKHLEPKYEAVRALLAAKVAVARREAEDSEEAAGKPAMLERQLRAAESLWARLRELRAVTFGLMVSRRAVDVRMHLSVAAGSPLSVALAGHPALAGDLNPPLPKQKFAALGYAAFEAEPLAALLQWLTDAAVDATLAAGGEEAGLAPVDAAALRGLFAGWENLLGGRLGLVMPIKEASQPVLQLDGAVELKASDSAGAWRGRAPGALDGLVYLADVAGKTFTGGKAGFGLASQLEPAVPTDGLAIDRWQLTLTAPRPKGEEAEGGEGAEQTKPTVAGLLAPVVLGDSGAQLWNTATEGYGYFSVAPDASRLERLAAYGRAARLGHAGDEAMTSEALRHVLRQSSAVLVFSPATVVQMISRAVLQRDLNDAALGGDIPIVETKAMATLSLRSDSRGLGVRLYIPVAELEPLLSTWRTFRLVITPGAGSVVPPVPPIPAKK